MGQAVLVHNEHSLDRSPHAVLIELISHPIEARRHRAVLLKQRFFCAKRIVRQRVAAAHSLYYKTLNLDTTKSETDPLFTSVYNKHYFCLFYAATLINVYNIIIPIMYKFNMQMLSSNSTLENELSRI